MAGTREGGIKAAKTVKLRFGPKHYQEIGRQGGNTKTTKPRGFAATGSEAAAAAGRVGGKASRRNYTRHDTRPVLQVTKLGAVIGTFRSSAEAARDTGIDGRNISHCCNSRRGTAGGFVWRYAPVSGVGLTNAEEVLN